MPTVNAACPALRPTGPLGNPISRPVREYLAALDQAEVEKSTPKNISLTDPAARWSAAGGPAFYAVRPVGRRKW